MKKLKCVGEGYHGFDPGENRHIFVKTNELVEVSDIKAEQLFNDFPTMWVDVGSDAPVQVKGKGKK